MTQSRVIELFYDDVWNDISGDVYVRSDLGITRGQRDESAHTDPARCALLIDNRVGRYSPRNPLSSLYGKIGRNTLLRVRLEDQLLTEQQRTVEAAGSPAWTAWAGTATVTRATDQFHSGVASAKGVYTGAVASNLGIQTDVPSSGAQPIVGQTYRAGVWVRSSRADTYTLYFRFWKPDGTWFDATQTLALAANTWTRMEASQVYSAASGAYLGSWSTLYVISFTAIAAQAVWVDDATLKKSVGYLWLPGGELDDSFVSRPDAAALDITGDIDVRIDLELKSWVRQPDGWGLARKYQTLSNQRSWALWVQSDGQIAFRWSADGTGTTLTEISDALPDNAGRLAIRVTLDVNDGAGNHVLKFYTAPTIAGPWVQWGATETVAGVTSIFNSTAPLEVGRAEAPSPGGGIATDAVMGKLYGFELRNGIDGTVVASEDFADLRLSSPWVLNGDALFIDESVRFSGEVPAWPPRWEESNTDAWVELEAAGILRRLNQGQKPLRSALYQDLSTADPAVVVGYWPLEEPDGATQLASGIGGEPATFGGTVDLASYSGFAASAPVPTLDDPGAFIDALLPPFAGAATQRAIMLLHVPEAGVFSKLFSVSCVGGSLGHFNVYARTNGNLQMQITDVAGNPIYLGTFGFAINGRHSLFSLKLTQVGADVTWQLVEFVLGSGGGGLGDTIAGQTIGRLNSIRLEPNDDGLDGTAFGHLAVLNGDSTEVLYDVLKTSGVAWTGEPAGERIRRLCDSQSMPLRSIGDISDTELLGAQPFGDFLNVLSDAAESDLGFLGEQRQAASLLYRTRVSLYNQTPVLVLDYADGEVGSPITPTDDDQHVRNVVEVKRQGGSSHISSLNEGALSTQDPPDGIGIYDTSVEISLASDLRTRDQAGWRLHMGTVDELRVAMLSFDLANERMEQHLAAIDKLAEGDRIQIINTPAWLPPGGLDLIVLGWTESIGPFTRSIVFNCSPANVWTVAVLEDLILGRFDTAGSELAAGIDDNDTSLSVAVTEGYLWTTADEPFDIVVGGEEMTVTAVTGASSPQTFTVTRSVNGIVKAHSAGAEVRLAHTAVVAL